MTEYHYAVVGAGRQGTAAAYDMAKYGDAASILMADHKGELAARAAERINQLIGREIATSAVVDVRDVDALAALLQPVSVFLCSTPLLYIMDCTRAAIQSATSMVDLGGHTDTVLKQLELSAAAKEKGISIVPDCGMGPGMNNTLGVYTVERLEAEGAIPREVRLWDGGLPQDPVEPWNYQVSFHINGLTNEYDDQAVFLRDGKITRVEPFTEMEIVKFAGVGELEAFVTSGGTSTAPYTFEGRLKVYQNKTCRYPGHFDQFRAFRDLGLFNEEPIEVEPGISVKPRDFFHTLLAPQIEVERVIDVCVMRAQGIGEKGGEDITLEVDLIDYYDDDTGFTAMERLTGWHAAIMAQFIARGEVQPGAWAMEKAVSSIRFVEEVRNRDFDLSERWL